MPSGIVLLKKEAGITSFGAVSRVRRLFSEKKAGHTGTLDPLATGVLPILIGRAVKASDYMLSDEKFYNAEMTLGITTDTEDITGNILSESSDIPSEKKILAAVSSFIGKIKQTPPMFSAVKVGGKKLYELAREGKVVERAEREVEIYSLTAARIDKKTYSLSVHCSKGTYIRTLISDIGKALGCGACMSALERCRASIFSIEECRTLAELEAMNDAERQSFVIPVERIFEKYEAVKLPPFFERLAKCGQEIYLHKIGKSYPLGTKLRILGKDGFFALGEVLDFEAGAAIKPIIQF